MQESWDNSGWQIRFPGEFNRILTALSLSKEVVKEAIETDSSLIVTHHPLFFHPCKSIDATTSYGEMITLMIQHSISLFALHTPADKGIGGLADWWASLLHLDNVSPLLPETSDPQCGLGRRGLLSQKVTADELARICNDAGYQVVNIGGDTTIHSDRVAILPGSGASVIEHLPPETIFITSDISYHNAELAKQRHIALINIPHFTMERPFTNIIAKIGQDNKVAVNISQREKDFFTYTIS